MEELQPPLGVDEFSEIEAHPLQNPVVLKRLFELIPFGLKDFRNFRLVSQAWHTLSLSSWRQNAKLILLDVDKDPEERGVWNASKISRQDYLELLENDQHQLVLHPYRKYFLERWNINLMSANPEGHQDQVRFWNRVGPLMTHLTLQTCDFAGVADLRTVIFQETPNLQSLSLIRNEYTTKRVTRRAQRLSLKLPQHALIQLHQVQNNLVEFNIDLVADVLGLSEYYSESDEEEEDDQATIEYFPITWMELFIHFPNIKKIGQLQLGFQAIKDELLEFFATLEILRKKHGPRYLEDLNELELSNLGAFDKRLISSINRLRFPFKKLALNILPEVDEETFRQLLQSSLESLNVTRDCPYGRVVRPFRKFPFGHQFLALKKLMSGPIAPNLMFLKECPNLEHFNYKPFQEDRFDADLTQVLSDGNHTKLEKLMELYITSDGCSAVQIRKLQILMPNVKKLSIGLDDGSFRFVCEGWRELELIRIDPFRVGEEALLGKDERTGENFRHPNITDLKNLKSFSMQDCHWNRYQQGHRQPLTEAVLLDGILALNNLEWASLCISSEVNLQVHNQLKMNIPTCYISTPPRVHKTFEKPHPLENPKVLERLFDLIPFGLEDFKNFRLVSRAWNRFSLETWRQNAWLSLRDFQPDQEEVEDDGDTDYEDVEDDGDSDYEDVDSDSDDGEEIPGISRQNYLELLENDRYQLIRHPFRKYILEGWNIKLTSANPDGEQEQDQTRFWNRVGPLMSHLDLTFCKFAGVSDFRTVIFEATPNLQSLKLMENLYIDDRPATKEERLDLKLSQHAVIPADQVQNNLVQLEIDLAIYRFDDDDDEDSDEDEHSILVEYLPITWMELIMHFPKIEKLGPLELGATAEAELLEFFKSAEILRKERGPGYLEHLSDLDLWQVDDDSRAFRGRLFSSINRLQFPLRRLSFYMHRRVDENTFKQLLQHPLKSLYVGRETSATRPFQNFPFGLEFKALRTLDLSGPISPNLMFLKECPNLESFVYTPFIENRLEADLTQVLSGENPTKLEKLNDLHIPSYVCSAEEIMKLGELMPSLKYFWSGLDDGSFRAVCDVWKELEFLAIDPFLVGEDALLGKEGGDKFRHPNLTDLKNLKTFTMEKVENRQDQQGLTEAGVLDGILTLPNLDLVKLYLSSEVPLGVRNQLEMKFPNCSISTHEVEEGSPAEN